MPCDEEKIFFQRAFRLIDMQVRTQWNPIYKSLESRSENGRIDWGLIPGILPNPYDGMGYIKAIKRVTQTLVELLDQGENDVKFQRKVKPLALLAATVYEIRLEQIQIRNGIEDEENGDIGHNAACSVWKETAETLGQAVDLNTIFIQPDQRLDLFVKVAKTLLAAACAVGACYLISQFI